MKSRITPQTKAIADAHIEAMRQGVFKDTGVKSKEELLEAMRQGYTFYGVLHHIENMYVNTTSLVLCRLSGYQDQTEEYKRSVYKGFKELLQ